MVLFGIKFDAFLGALVLAIGLAIAFPFLGATGGQLRVDVIAKYGVVLIFFFSGLSLDPTKMRAGLPHIVLHMIIQATTFIAFPALVLLFQRVARPLLPTDVWTGFVLVGALPSTVSLSIAMVARAQGNVPAATFNAMASSLIGAVVTPLLVAWYLSRTGAPLNLGHVSPRVAVMVLAPIVAGIVARRWLAGWAIAHKPRIQIIDRTIMVAIVYSSLCDSISKKAWPPDSAAVVFKILIGAALLFAVAYTLVTIICSVIGFSPRDRIACAFCASTKSLAFGAPLGALMFSGHAGLGLTVTPIIAYHVLQLMITRTLATRAQSASVMHEAGVTGGGTHRG